VSIVCCVFKGLGKKFFYVRAFYEYSMLLISHFGFVVVVLFVGAPLEKDPFFVCIGIEVDISDDDESRAMTL
jgi:hypothetical protein